jgi:hypothetical protein
VCKSDTCLPGECPDAGPTWSVGNQWAAQCTSSATCPPTPPTTGAACTQTYAYCALADGTPCGCFSGAGGTTWTCFHAPTDPKCPKAAPALGSPCTDEGLACADYDVCVLGSRVLCKGGVWVDNLGNCPS